jgi:hypothetical protein
VRAAFSGRPLPRWTGTALGAWVLCVLVLSYDLPGRAWMLLLHSYHLTTWMLLLLLLLTVRAMPRKPETGGLPVTHPTARDSPRTYGATD